MPSVMFYDVSKEYPGGARALDHLDLTVAAGEFLILLGPSGCGKTTALRLLAGLDKPTSGTIAIDGHAVTDVPPGERDIAMVFQNYALYPHMTVQRNLAFGLRQRRIPKAEIDRRVREVSSMLGLEPLLKRKPAQLSGGQRQRVAMGRALVREPKAFLLDEPLSNLDAQLRVEMRAGLKRLHQAVGVTTLYVTHDQVEAMTLGDRIAVMSAGRIQQIGTPEEVYARPETMFVAAFIGSPSMNLLRGSAAGGRVRAGDLDLALTGVPAGEVVVGIRPEHLRPCARPAPAALDGRPATAARDLADAPDAAGVADLVVEVVEPLGSETLVHGTVRGSSAAPAGSPAPDGDGAAGDGRARMVARIAGRTHPGVGERIGVRVDPADVLLFDPRTGNALPRRG